MPQEILNNKQAIRKQIASYFTSISPRELQYRSKQLLKKLISLQEFQNAKTVMLYMPLNDEVDVSPILRSNDRRYVLPRIENDSLRPITFISLVMLRPGKFGILEPINDDLVSPQEIDVVVVPGMAFTKDGVRVGRGGGYYDRFLPTLGEQTKTVSLALKFQVFNRLPFEQSHDYKVGQVICESR